MPYRLCTFDSFGRLTSVSAASYSDTSELVAETIGLNPLVHAFVDETVLPSNRLIDTLVDGNENATPTYNGLMTSFKSTGGADAYDPRSEVTLLMDYPYPNITYGTRVVQDVTNGRAVGNRLDTTTKPQHSTTQKKFGPSSGKFTKSGGGYTGGFIYVTNLSKRNLGGYTAPHNNIGAGATHSYAIEMFFYPTTTASNFTLAQKGPTGASANWKLAYDSSAGFLQFAWQSYGTSGGYNYSQNIINTAGLTTNTWHHVAVALVRNGAGVCYQMSGYFNGINKFTFGVTSSATLPEVRYDGALYIGNNNAGTESFDGYIDSLRMLESGVTSGLFGPSGYGFLPYAGGTLGVPTLLGFTKNSETCFLLNFNGIDGVQNFYCESTDYVAGTAVTISDVFVPVTGGVQAYYAQVGFKDIVRYTLGYAGATSYSDPTGFTINYGAIVNQFVNTAVPGTTAYYVHGYDYPFALYQVYDNQPLLNVYATNYRNDILFNRNLELLTTIEGCSGNKGSSGSIFNTQIGQNPFRRLFAANNGLSYGSGANHNSLYLNPLDTSTMKYIMDSGYLATQGICLASYSFIDAKGITRKLSATEISNLRLDILEYQNNIKNAATVAKGIISTAATVNDIKTAKINKLTGYSSGGNLSAE